MTVPASTLTLLAFSLVLSSCTGTRPNDIGIEGGRLTPCPPTPNCVSSFETDDQHRIEAFRVTGDPGRAWDAALTTIRNSTRTHIVDSGDRYVHAEYTSKVFRFVDDLELLLLPDTSLIAVRSASRIGRRDFGVNRERVETLRAQLVEQGVVAPTQAN